MAFWQILYGNGSKFIPRIAYLTIEKSAIKKIFFFVIISIL